MKALCTNLVIMYVIDHAALAAAYGCLVHCTFPLKYQVSRSSHHARGNWSAVEMRVQDPELLVDPAREVRVQRRTACILDLGSARNGVPQPRGVGGKTLRQRPHMGVALLEGASRTLVPSSFVLVARWS